MRKRFYKTSHRYLDFFEQINRLPRYYDFQGLLAEIPDMRDINVEEKAALMSLVRQKMREFKLSR